MANLRVLKDGDERVLRGKATPNSYNFRRKNREDVQKACLFSLQIERKEREGHGQQSFYKRAGEKLRSMRLTPSTPRPLKFSDKNVLNSEFS